MGSDSELLLALCYRDLATRTHEYLDDLAGRRNMPDYGGRHVEQVTVAYPAVTPSAARAALKQLVTDALSCTPHNVDTSYDEAVAAALYFMQRELGGDGQAASTRCPPGRGGFRRPRRAGSTMLVVDIGGGTTDIAVLGWSSPNIRRTQTLSPATTTRSLRQRAAPPATTSSGPGSRKPSARSGRWPSRPIKRWPMARTGRCSANSSSTCATN